MSLFKKNPLKSEPELGRMELSILIVLYEKHPIPMTESEILSVIAERQLMEMTDEEFEQYRKNIVIAKKN